MCEWLKIKHVVPVLLLLGFVYINGQPVHDTDAWWHLKVGQYIWQTGSVPHYDIFSFSNFSHPWITHEWLAEVIYYAAYYVGDFQGIFLFNLLLLSFVFYFYARLTNLRTDSNYSVTSVALITGAFFTALFWVFRPHMFSHLLIILFLYILQLYYQGRDYLWVLPLLMVFWVNAHGSFIMGFILIALYLIVGIFKIEWGAIKNQRWNRNQIKKLTIILFLTLLATIFNPNTYQILLYPFQTVGSSYITELINEWSSPNFHEPYFLLFLGYMLLGILMMAISGQKHRLIDICLVGMFAFMSLYAVRNVALFIFGVGPVFSYYLTGVFNRRKNLVQDKDDVYPIQDSPKEVYWLNWVIILVLIVGVVNFWPPLKPIEKHVNREKFPVEAVNFIKSNGLSGNIFNDYNWGGYLLWTTYPENRVMIDGRSDIYADKVFPDYYKIYNLLPGSYSLLAEYCPDLILIEKGRPLDVLLKGKKEWQQVYSDELAVIYLPSKGVRK